MVSLIWDKDKNCPTTTVTLASVSINFFSLYCNGGVIGLCLPKSSLKWRDTHSTNPNVFFFFLLLFQVECNGWGDAMLEFAETGFSLRHTGELFYSVLRGGEIWHKDLFNAGCLYAYRRSKDKKKYSSTIVSLISLSPNLPSFGLEPTGRGFSLEEHRYQVLFPVWRLTKPSNFFIYISIVFAKEKKSPSLRQLVNHIAFCSENN